MTRCVAILVPRPQSLPKRACRSKSLPNELAPCTKGCSQRRRVGDSRPHGMTLRVVLRPACLNVRSISLVAQARKTTLGTTNRRTFHSAAGRATSVTAIRMTIQQQTKRVATNNGKKKLFTLRLGFRRIYTLIPISDCKHLLQRACQSSTLDTSYTSAVEERWAIS